MRNNIFAASVLTLFLVIGIPSAASAAQTVTVTLPTFPVTLNSCQLPPAYDRYPVIVYKDITYFPMTYHYGDFLGLTTHWDNNTLTVDKKMLSAQNYCDMNKRKKIKANKQPVLQHLTL